MEMEKEDQKQEVFEEREKETTGRKKKEKNCFPQLQTSSYLKKTIVNIISLVLLEKECVQT